MRNSTARQNWSWQCRYQSDSDVWAATATSRDNPRRAHSGHQRVQKPLQPAGHASAQLAQHLQHPWEIPFTSGWWKDTWLEACLVLCMDRWLARNKPVHLGTEPNSSTILTVMFLPLVQEFSWGIIPLNTPESYRWRKIILISTLGIDN